MRFNMYTIYDSCAQVYQRPFAAQSDGEAMREFGDIANGNDHPISRHPEHYSIWRIGTFSGSDGELGYETKECLAHAIDLLQDKPQQDLLSAVPDNYGQSV